ncbi:MAG: hypothetical protein ACRDRM_01700 [Pseudonocardiaceae bacterium]
MTAPRRSRRRVLAAGVAAGTLLVAGPAALAGCTSSAPPAPEQPDPLELPARRAESDAALAQAVATAHPALATAADAFATDRQAHAAALRTELHRVRPSPAPSSPTPSSSAPPTPTPFPAATDQAEARDALAGAAQAAQDEAARLVPRLPGYRAALLASVTACCASHAAVSLRRSTS